MGDFIRSLDYRARKVIRALGVKDFYTLTALTPAAILAQPNVAETTLRNIREQLQALGLGLQRRPCAGVTSVGDATGTHESRRNSNVGNRAPRHLPIFAQAPSRCPSAACPGIKSLGRKSQQGVGHPEPVLGLDSPLPKTTLSAGPPVPGAGSTRLLTK